MLHRDQGVGIRAALLYTSSISKVKDLNIIIEKLEEFVQQKKEAIIPLEPDCDRWEQIFRENATLLNTFHLLDKAGKKAQKEDKKHWTDFNDLYLEYAKYRDFVQAWAQYETRKRERNALDYGDLNEKALQFLNTYGAEWIDETYRYIIIDEFQDTNYVQFELIKLLSEKYRNITVVADTNQTIYAFRGAYANNIQEYFRYFGIQQDDIVALDVSFRSTGRILSVSHDLIFDCAKKSVWQCHAQIIMLITRPRQHSSDYPSAMIFRAISTSFGTKSTGTRSSPTVLRIMCLAHADGFLAQYFFFIIFAIAGLSSIPSLKNAQVSVYSHCTIYVTSYLSIIPAVNGVILHRFNPMGILLYYRVLYCPARDKGTGHSKVAADTGLMSADLVFKQKVRDRSRELNQ